MARYPALLEPEDGGFNVTFRDIPEALTCGDSLEDAKAMAADALLTAMDFYFERRQAVPRPSAPREGEVLIPLPATIWAKVQLLNEMVAGRITQAELARRLNARPQEVTRLLDPHHATKIETLQAAYDALVGAGGMELQVRRWLQNSGARAEAADPAYAQLKEWVRQATDQVNALTDDDPRFIAALQAQTEAINRLIAYGPAKVR